MSELLYNASFFIAVAALVAIVWRSFTSDGSPPTDRTPDLFDPYDDDDGWGDADGD